MEDSHPETTYIPITERLKNGAMGAVLGPVVMLSTPQGAVTTGVAIGAGYLLHRKNPALVATVVNYGLPTLWAGWAAYCLGSNLAQSKVETSSTWAEKIKSVDAESKQHTL